MITVNGSRSAQALGLGTYVCMPSIQKQRLLWILRETFEPNQTRGGSFLTDVLATGKAGLVGSIFEVGPRLTFCTAYSSNAVSGGPNELLITS